MLFNKEIMIELINRIDSNRQLDGKIWYEKILYALEPESVSPMGFSEFETYGNFCYNFYPNMYVERTLPSFRSGGLIQGRFVSDKILERLSFDQATASFEIYDCPPFPWSKLVYWYARTSKKIKTKPMPITVTIRPSTIVIIPFKHYCLLTLLLPLGIRIDVCHLVQEKLLHPIRSML